MMTSEPSSLFTPNSIISYFCTVNAEDLEMNWSTVRRYTVREGDAKAGTSGRSESVQTKDRKQDKRVERR